MHPVSDRDLIARSRTDMAYKYFLGLRPENDVIDPSLLTVFRRQRIRDINLMDLLLRSSLDKAKALGLIVSKKILVDSLIHYPSSEDTLLQKPSSTVVVLCYK